MTKGKKSTRVWRKEGVDMMLVDVSNPVAGKMVGEVYPDLGHRAGERGWFTWAAYPIGVNSITVMGGLAPSQKEAITAVETALRVLEAP